MQEVHTSFGLVGHTVILSNSPGTDGRSIAILNQVDITSESNKVLNLGELDVQHLYFPHYSDIEFAKHITLGALYTVLKLHAVLDSIVIVI